ncbi:rhomboid family intramembrane serine protease [Nocardioides panacisoli]|uniref:rhomboid family intramembrane serine protease n=1 Tax=Nocardioides panacisoli TaxID=627624 RepID=UPI001C63A68B|nr:rhomboid family intramembrane serine protease [Nocardioides panacisoli]QYJ03974.1 rhomboid family intramembrane serine protease [Nocardioides panacisoli]
MARRPRSRMDEWQQTTLLVLGFAALLWFSEIVDVFLGNALDEYGVRPRTDEGLLGILFAPLLHGGWTHLWANTIPVVILGFLTLITGVRRGLAATAIIWVVAGLGVWLVGDPGTVHLGASGLVFGWISHLALRGFLNRRANEIFLGILVLFLYGSVLVGVLPGQPGVSWEGHLFGLVGGLVAAYALRDRAGRQTRRGATYPR